MPLMLPARRAPSLHPLVYIRYQPVYRMQADAVAAAAARKAAEEELARLNDLLATEREAVSAVCVCSARTHAGTVHTRHHKSTACPWCACQGSSVYVCVI